MPDQDYDEIPRLDHGQDARFYQDRARLRAGDADLVATARFSWTMKDVLLDVVHFAQI